jgi:hypothetical protein
MIETSKDLLYVVLAFSVLWLTIFISWTLYYVIMMLRQANQLVGSFKEKVEKISQAVEKIRDKFDHTSAYIGLVGKAVEKLIDFVGERKKKSKR